MDIRKLQRAIVDGLEDVKGQNIVVFNTEHLSPLFERVIIASGTSNRQTKSLAASVRDSVKAAGMPPPRVEGEANGEWIIVDCGAAVVHVMQPSFRDYYHLEELWGEKPVRVKLGGGSSAARGAAKGDVPASETEASAGDGERRSPARKAAVSRAPAAKKAVTRTGGMKTPSRGAGAKTVGQKKPGKRTAAPATRTHTAGTAGQTTRRQSAGQSAGSKSASRTAGSGASGRSAGKAAGAKAAPGRSTAAGGRAALPKSTATRRAAPAKRAPAKKATPRAPARKR
jgi:ribosome-associated protein